ncbi:BTB domain-containing protein [Favolaschia claudopus]|uniref:BTB domain-containing protein n=1 Tax=Favolaschia claudopus TaxID=2862362 RepID=A0AAW0A9R3_9AGAR
MAQVIHDPDLYFQDGNIALSARSQVQNPPTHIIFRVHQSILVKHSQIFDDMFNVATATVNGPQHAGIPLVTMPDEAEGLRELLMFLYDPDDFALRLLVPCELARKYFIDWIRTKAAERLLRSWPDTLGDWRRLDGEETRLVLQRAAARADQPLGFQLREFPEPVSSILLARECNVTIILPVAFLYLLHRSVEPDPNDLYAAAEQRIELELLPVIDGLRLFQARQRMGTWFARYPKKSSPSLSTSKISACDGTQACKTTVAEVWLRLSELLADGCCNMLTYSLGEDMKDICPGCKTKLAKEVSLFQSRFFDNVPRFFGFQE